MIMIMMMIIIISEQGRVKECSNMFGRTGALTL